MQKNEKLNSNDTLFFPKEVVFKTYKSFYVAIAIETANWIVLPNQFQVKILKDLMNGTSIGNVISSITEAEIKQIKSLLSKLLARKFASKKSPPELSSTPSSNFLNIYLTNECNLRCNHCFMNSGNKLDNELSTSAWLKVIDDFRTLGGEHLTISGGEPLMNKDFSRILKYSSDLGIKNTVLSNGTLWTQELIDELSQYISEIQISIDGVDEKSNSIVRGSGHYNNAVNSVVRFSNNGVRTSVAKTFTFENIKFANTYQEFVNQIVSKTENQVFFKLSRKILKGRSVNYSDTDNIKFYEIISEIEENVNSLAYLQNFMIDHEPNLGLKNCGFGGLSITSNGDVFMCNRISEVESYGNVSKNTLSYFFNIGNRINDETSVNNVKPCCNCELKYICGGGCRIDDFNFKGKLNGFKNLVQINCDTNFKNELLKKMVESFNAYYKF